MRSTGNWIGVLALVLLVSGLAGYCGWALRGGYEGAEQRVQHRNAGLRIDEVRKLASLTTLEVPISDVQTTTLAGITGGVSVVLLVRGDVAVATDLDKARFESVDEPARRAVLVLPLPRPARPRLNLEVTQVLRVDRSGLWRIYPGPTAEGKTIDLAMAEAQRLVSEAARQPVLVQQARQHAEVVLARFFAAMQWQVEIKWTEEVTK